LALRQLDTGVEEHHRAAAKGEAISSLMNKQIAARCRSAK
jgi:hypothetical protein